MKLQLSAAVALLLRSVVVGMAQSPPVITEGGVLNSASLQPSISAGCRVLIRGSNLASSSISVTAETLIDGRIPFSLGGVKVSINDVVAPLLSIGPEGVEILIPHDAPIGPAKLVLTNEAGSSEAAVEVLTYAPAFFSLDGGRYADLRDGAGNRVLSFRPGDTLNALLTGLGTSEPPLPSDQWPAAEIPLPRAIQVRLNVGQAEAEILSVVLVGPGQYRVNFLGPFVAPGDATMSFIIGGAASPEVLGVVERHPGASLTTSAPELSLQTLELGSASQKVTVGSGLPGLPVRVSSFTVNGIAWLSAEPKAGVTPLTITVSASAAALNTGTHQGEIRLESDAADNSPFVVPVSFGVTSAKAPRITGISPDPIPSGRQVLYFSIFGTNLETTTSVELQPGLTIPLAGISSRTRGAVQVKLQLPGLLRPETRQLRVTTSAGTSEPLPVQIDAVTAGGGVAQVWSVSVAEFLTGVTTRFAPDSVNTFFQRIEVIPLSGVTVHDVPELTIEVTANALPGMRTLRLTRAGVTSSLPISVRRPEPELTGVRPAVLWPGRTYFTADIVSAAGLKYTGLDLLGISGMTIEPPDDLVITRDDKLQTTSGSLMADSTQIKLAVQPGAATGIRRVSLRTTAGPTNTVPLEVQPVPSRAPVLESVSSITFGQAGPFGTPVIIRLSYRDAENDVNFDGRSTSGLFVSAHTIWFPWRVPLLGSPRRIDDRTVEVSGSVPNSVFANPTMLDPLLTLWLVDAAGNLSNSVQFQYKGQWMLRF